MKKPTRKGLVLGIMMILLPVLIMAQTTVSGKVTDAASGDGLAGVNIIVKGKVVGTITDTEGEFNLKVSDGPPFTLVISFVGYATQEFEITESGTNLNVVMEEQTLLGQEVVVSASRIEESILESPVSIEKMDILAVQQTSADNYYKGLANLKGVDVATSSINFQIINARGFGSTGNTRFVQLIDGMDTQAPALNFPIGNLNGPSELDVESVELIPGAASALYGPNAFNGIVLMTSKSAFDYQGVSAFAKVGVNHVGQNADQGAAPLFEGAFRYAKAYNDKFAFKVNFAYMRADDWHGTDPTDRNAALTPRGFDFNPGADRLHFHGDEPSINLAIFPLSDSWRVLARNEVFAPGLTAETYADAGDLPSHVVSTTPYPEQYIVDYGAENIKANVGLYYRLNDNAELSYTFNGGFGTSVYTGAQRYSLQNFGIQQHKMELKGSNYFVRGYTTIENSGDSYIAEFLSKRIHDIAAGGDVSTILGTYGVEYLAYLNSQGLQPGEINNLPEDQRIQIQQDAHMAARGIIDSRFLLDPNSEQFETIKTQALEGVVPFGPKFNDQSSMWQVDGQYNFENVLDGVQVGASSRLFMLNSNGTIFPDTAGNDISILEYGAFVQAAQGFADDKLKVLASLRFDKNENFQGQLNPRVAFVYKPAPKHNIRASFQTGFRNPTTQGQFIDLNVLSARLLGGLPQFYESYQLTNNGYTATSVAAYSQAVFDQGATPAAIVGNVDLLEEFTEADVRPVAPEQIQTIELGYKSLINNSTLIDINYYYNAYRNFITQIQVRRSLGGDVKQNPALGATMLNGSALNTFQIYTNNPDLVQAQGVAAGINYRFVSGYTLGGNYNWNKLITDDLSEKGFLNDFNTPEHKMNIQFGNRKLTDNLGFNVTFRWQNAFLWESSFARGNVPAYSTLDAQVTYKLDGIKSLLKVGGSNLLNQKYIQSLGGVNIGALYYVSLTFDELLN